MTSIVVVGSQAVLILRQGAHGMVEEHLNGRHPRCLAVDVDDPSRWYVGTQTDGLWRTADGGMTWEPAGSGIPYPDVTAVAVAAKGTSGNPAIYAGTEPSTLSRSDDRGATWRTLEGLAGLPSSSRWSFPPKPDTHHVRWIEPDPTTPDSLYVAIEAGALVRSKDGGATWHDRVEGGPFDSHTLATHHEAPGFVCAAAGDGYYESVDGGDHWTRPMGGLNHGYLVGVAIDRGDPDTVIVSGAPGPHVAYRPPQVEAYLYRKEHGGSFAPAMEGLPGASGSTAARLAGHPETAGVFFAVNNHGLFRSHDSGKSWTAVKAQWPAGALADGAHALALWTE